MIRTTITTALLAALLLGSAHRAAAISLIKLRVANPTERQFRISYEQDALTGRQRIFRVKLRDDNTAAFELQLADETELTMRYGGIDVPLFIGPEDSLSIELDAEGGLESLAFGGPAAEDNRFLLAYAKAFPRAQEQEIGGGFLPVLVGRDVLAKAATADTEEFAGWANAYYDARANFVAPYRGRIDERLYERYLRRARNETELAKLAYLVFNQQMMSPPERSAAANRLGLRSPETSRDLKLLADPTFREYLKAYAQMRALPSSGSHDERQGDALFKAVQTALDRPWRHYLQSELLVNAFDYLGNPEFGLDRYAAMKRDGAEQRFRDRVEKAYGEVLNLAPDAMAPNIGMYYADGRPVSLTDLSGKVVYISFWASWCKPCLANFRKYDGIRQQLQQKGVTLLNVSIDDDEFDWKKSLDGYTPRGENTRATNVDDVKRSYNLASIPAYYIIDKHGRIAVLPERDRRDLLSSFDEIIRR